MCIFRSVHGFFKEVTLRFKCLTPMRLLPPPKVWPSILAGRYRHFGKLLGLKFIYVFGDEAFRSWVTLLLCAKYHVTSQKTIRGSRLFKSLLNKVTTVVHVNKIYPNKVHLTLNKVVRFTYFGASNDRSIGPSTESFPQSAIQSFLFQVPVSLLFYHII
jgi:hypothetical protein